jgi:hypothetical protein
MKTRLIILATVFSIVGFAIHADAADAWKQVGLAGKEVTALVTVSLSDADTLLIAGTKKEARRGNSGNFQLLDNLGETQPSSFLKGINALYLHQKSSLLFAASDSGLSWYPLITMIEPRWTKVAGVTGFRVTDVTGRGDTLFCCSAADVFRSFDGGMHWAACSARTFLPPLGNITSFTSLAFWNGINAGSLFLGAMNSWLGVMNSVDNGQHWQDISLLAPQTQSVGQVFDLIRHPTRSQLYAATDQGVMLIKGDIDTGYWSKMNPQPKEANPAALYITYTLMDDSSTATLFARGDSGVWVLYELLDGSAVKQGWTRVSTRKTYCMTSFGIESPGEWFAGTDDGVWRYGWETRTIRRADLRRTANPMALRYYSLDGRLLANGKNRLPKGIVLMVSGNGRERVARRCIIADR